MADLPHIRTLDPEVLTKEHVGKAAVTSVLKTIQPVCDESGRVLTTGGAKLDGRAGWEGGWEGLQADQAGMDTVATPTKQAS